MKWVSLGESRRLLYRSAVLVTALATAWTSLSISAASVLAGAQSARALTWWRSPEALAGLSLELVGKGNSDSIAKSGALAREALSQTPVSASSVRNLALVEGINGNGDASKRLFQAAERISRRDLQTQLWHIEDCITRDDIKCALKHYDRALRTSLASRDLLLPVLVSASADVAVRSDLLRLIAPKPSWRIAFLDQIADASTDPTSLSETLIGAGLDLDNAEEQALFARALWRLVGLQAYREAFSLYTAKRPPSRQEFFLRDGDFEAERALGPYEWQLVDEPGLSAVRAQAPQANKGSALFLSVDNGRGGGMARQLLALPPGRYHLFFQSGGVSANPGAQPVIEIACMGGARLLDVRGQSLAQSGRTAATFEVPFGNCGAQSIQISLLANVGVGELWVDAIELVKAEK